MNFWREEYVKQDPVAVLPEHLWGKVMGNLDQGSLAQALAVSKVCTVGGPCSFGVTNTMEM